MKKIAYTILTIAAFHGGTLYASGEQDLQRESQGPRSLSEIPSNVVKPFTQTTQIVLGELKENPKTQKFLSINPKTKDYSVFTDEWQYMDYGKLEEGKESEEKQKCLVINLENCEMLFGARVPTVEEQGKNKWTTQNSKSKPVIWENVLKKGKELTNVRTKNFNKTIMNILCRGLYGNREYDNLSVKFQTLAKTHREGWLKFLIEKGSKSEDKKIVGKVLTSIRD